MANSKNSAFRERFTEIDKGIKVEQPKRLPNVEGLKLDTSFDLSQLGSFTASPVDIKGAAEKVKPQGMGDLRVDTDLGHLDESIEKIKRQQIDERIRGLVEEAERLIAKKKYQAALKPLDKAIGIDPASAQALILKGYCLFGLRDYDSAFDLLEEARQYAREGETVLLILTLQAACMRAAAEEVEARLADLIEAGKFSQALDMIERELSRHPANVVMLYYKSIVFLIMGRADDAKRTARAAIQRVGEENADLFYELLDHLTLQENIAYLEKARLALRRSDPAEAIRQLEICRVALTGQEQFEAVWAYAQEKRRRGILKTIFSRNRSATLVEDTRQKLLQWLLDEELRDGSEALGQERFAAAVAIFD
ncbi:MAG: tetratricopeptide repeat protein, partial [Blastocatellia bacterium]|nr:tetratricopeptide repeat protein [Blastocatellia bacterium]